MTLEETIGAVIESKLTPLRQTLASVHTELVTMRRSLPPLLVSQAEAATLLCISLSSVRRRVRDGTLPVRVLGRTVKVDLGALQAPSPLDVARLAKAAREGERIPDAERE